MADEGWTVPTLAEHTGVSVSVIRLYLKGERMPKPDRDTGHRLAEGFHPDTQEELFDAWGYDVSQRKPRRGRAQAPGVPQGFMEVLLRIDAKLDLLIDIEEKLTEILVQNGSDPKVRAMSRGNRVAGNEGTN